MNAQQRFSAQASGLQCTSYRSTNACVAVNCIRCGRVTMVAGSAALVQGCERFPLNRDQVWVIKVFSRGSGQATCVSCVEVLCRVMLLRMALQSCSLITPARSVKISDICGEMNPLVFSALEEVNLVFILMMSSTVMVDIVFARFMFCTFYWR